MSAAAAADTEEEASHSHHNRLPYRNNPDLTASARVDVTASPPVLREQISRAVGLIRPDLFGSGETSASPPQPTSSSLGGEQRTRSGSLEARARRVSIKQLGGGLSNHLFVVTAVREGRGAEADDAEEDNDGGWEDEEEGEAVLVRIHSEGDDGDDKEDESNDPTAATASSFVNRRIENRTLAYLSSRCRPPLAPTLDGLFLNGRVEQFYSHHRPLAWHEMSEPRFARGVARALGRLHRLNVKELNGEVYNDTQGGGGLDEEVFRAGDVWDRVDKWFDMARRGCDTDTDSDAAARSSNELGGLLEEMADEWAWVKGELRRGPTSPDAGASDDDGGSAKDNVDANVRDLASSFFREVVFAHMDCQSLNILTPIGSDPAEAEAEAAAGSTKAKAKGDGVEEEKEDDAAAANACTPVRLIDFEYAALNPRAVDLANTFCEHCDMNNLMPDYGEQYPTPDQQDVFLRAYVSEVDPALARRLDGATDGDGDGGQEGLLVRVGGQGEWDEFLSAARDVIGKHTLVSHLGWAVWAVAQSALSSIEFDYVAYARLRMDGYRHFKGRYWP